MVAPVEPILRPVEVPEVNGEIPAEDSLMSECAARLPDLLALTSTLLLRCERVDSGGSDAATHRSVALATGNENDKCLFGGTGETKRLATGTFRHINRAGPSFRDMAWVGDSTFGGQRARGQGRQRGERGGTRGAAGSLHA